MEAVTIPVMAKARVGHFAEAQILQALKVDMIDESEGTNIVTMTIHPYACSVYIAHMCYFYPECNIFKSSLMGYSLMLAPCVIKIYILSIHKIKI